MSDLVGKPRRKGFLLSRLIYNLLKKPICTFLQLFSQILLVLSALVVAHLQEVVVVVVVLFLWLPPLLGGVNHHLSVMSGENHLNQEINILQRLMFKI